MNLVEKVKLLMDAKDAYYNDEEPIMTDDEFNALELEVLKEDPTNSYFLATGAEVRGDKVKLPVPMGGLEQIYAGDGEKWIKNLGFEDEVFIETDKLDGLSGLLVYGHNGKLQIAFSRGDGIEGADITRHVLKMKNVPKIIGNTMMTRVEFILKEADFETLNNSGALGRKFKNARNYAAGQMNRKDADDIFYEYVHVVAYEVKDHNHSKKSQLLLLQREGFEIPGYVIVMGNEINDEQLIATLQTAKARSPYALDGIVVDLNSIIGKDLGDRNSSSLAPMHARKFKVNDNGVIVKVVDVHWNISKLGYLKPRVEIVPVELKGVTITFATGFNAKFIRDSMIGPGAEIQITRSGDVIPFIEKVITPAAEAAMPDEDFGETYWTPNEVDLVLVEDHADARVKRLAEFFGGIEVPALRRGNIDRLVEAGFETIESIILASEDQLKAAIGDSNGSKIYLGIKEKLNPIPLWKLAGSSQMFGRGIGKRKMKKLEDKYGDFRELSLTQIIDTPGYSRITAELVVEGLKTFAEFLAKIDGYYAIAEKVAPAGDLYKGVVVVFTGIRDPELEKKIVDQGGVIGSGVNDKTTHLVAKDPTSGSGKLKKAADLGVKVIGIEEARALWGA